MASTNKMLTVQAAPGRWELFGYTQVDLGDGLTQRLPLVLDNLSEDSAAQLLADTTALALLESIYTRLNVAQRITRAEQIQMVVEILVVLQLARLMP